MQQFVSDNMLRSCELLATDITGVLVMVFRTEN